MRFKENDRVLMGGLMVLSSLLYVLNLGSTGLWEKHEALYAEVAREMLVDGHWIIPHLDGTVYIEKPPLYFWMVALCSIPVGDVNEFTARLPAALCAMGTVMVTFLLGRKLFNARVAFMGALILATCLLFMVYGRSVRQDTTFTFFISSALLAFYSGYTSDRKTFCFLSFWFLTALAVLTKGLFALFLVVSPIILYLFWNNDLKILIERRFLFGGSAFVLTITAWLLPAYVWDEGDYIRQFILVNSGLSYALPLAESKHHHNVLRYVVGYFFYGMMPWSIFLIAFSYRFFSKRLWRENRQLLFPAAWLFVMFLIFFLMGQKRSTYLLPLYPPAALLIAAWWDGLMERSQNIHNPWLLRGLGCLLVVVLGSEVVWVCQGISSRAMIVFGSTVFSIFAFGAFLVYSGRFKELFIFVFLIAVSTGVSYNQIFLPGEKKDILRKVFYKELNSSLGTCTTLGVYGYGLDYKELLF
ncbi:MAG TPA: ArnT family glycosyltransferase, partial [Candidatus Tripitaka californicus]|uniref:ArnT family glycosyltransferase n=1 Tax=Candidatus Tripitaka californicus TaxID=3367616 RepID=UPI004024CB69